LLDLNHGELLVQLAPSSANAFCVEEEASRLFVLGIYGTVYYWDLRAIRLHLSEIGLDWPATANFVEARDSL